MKPSRWPNYLDSILAKSADRGGETLAEHTWDVLEQLAGLRTLRPALQSLTETPQLWHCLFWTCLFHDFGKAARGFQSMLAGGDRWPQRHEVLSLACFDWIASTLSMQEQQWVVAAVVSHHRDAKDIQRLYDEVDPDPLGPLLTELEPDVVSQLWHWVYSCAEDWIHTLGFTAEGVHLLTMMPHDEAVTLVLRHGAERVRFWLRRYIRWVADMDEPRPASEVSVPILLRGLTITADHLASAHVGALPRPIRENWKELAARILKPGQKPYYHQEASANRSGRSALLIAPTGSGKTEAALYWVLGDGSVTVSRLFYALPYQASMNAMFDRLRDAGRGFGPQTVGLQHGRALQALYLRLLDQDTQPHAAVSVAKWERNLNSLHARPVKVFSPYQMLKAMFQLRGFEAMFTDFTQAAFIFDEIHAYEPGRLALILAMVRYLRVGYGARFFVMSATFPQTIRDRLSTALALEPNDIIEADQATFQKFHRHRLHLLDGGLLENGIDRIVRDVRAGRSVLACANTVRRAQDVRKALLKAGLLPEQVFLIHSRFIMKHRTEREQDILQRCQVGNSTQPFVLVATQVVEVSLNIDLDTIYTDPAPLEALLQRFGRVNRACQKGISPVYVFRQPDNGQYVYGRHKDPRKQGYIVRVALGELETHDGQEIDESQIGTWLDRIYQDPSLRVEWEEAYQNAAMEADVILRQLRPFNSDPQTESQFEEMFDNIDVLPQCFEQDYVDHMTKEEFIEASQYFVGISNQKFVAMKRKGFVRQIADSTGKGRAWMVLLPYSSQNGLSFDGTEGDPDFD